MIEFTLHGLKLESLANKREHWTRSSSRAKSQRGDAYRLALVAFYPRPTLPAVVTITRVAPRALDSDNLAISAKHVRDGIADAMGIDDRDERVEWRYEQAKGAPRAYATRVTVACVGLEPVPVPRLPPSSKTRQGGRRAQRVAVSVLTRATKRSS
jgi:hypothetical protein